MPFRSGPLLSAESLPRPAPLNLASECASAASESHSRLRVDLLVEDEKEPLLCPACQRRFSLSKAIPKLTPLQRRLLIKIERTPGAPKRARMIAATA
jgi:uncharacterized protein YbaR (Trm112 family)